jgi:hypothetical protein
MPMLRPRKSATWSSLKPCSGVSLMLISPLSSFSSPARTIRSVDLPDPDGPTMPTDSPAAIYEVDALQHMDGRSGAAERQIGALQVDDGFCQQ